MVTKRAYEVTNSPEGSVLAKIHIVTKHASASAISNQSSVLAKIHMVTKPQKYGSTFLNVIEY